MGEYVKLISNCSTSYATTGDIITYNIVCTNESSIIFSNIFISNILNPNFKFIKDSIKINNIEQPGLNILSGISIGKLGALKKTTITFELEILSKDSDMITLNSCAECVYKEGNEQKSILVNSSTLLHISEPSIYITKSVNKYKVSLNDKVTYTIKLVNNGDTYLDKIILNDDIYQNLEVVQGSFTINSNIVNELELEKGINIGSLGVNDCTIIQYDAIVRGKGVYSKIINKAFVTYNYYLDNGTSGLKKSEVVSCDLSVSLPSFKQISIDEYIKLPPHKEDIHCIENINTDINIKSHHTIRTPIATSNEGTALSGNKLIIHGSISQIIRYTTTRPNNSVHSLEYEMPFSTFIILPHDYMLGSKIQLDTKEEYTHSSLVNSRCIFESISILILAKTLK